MSILFSFAIMLSLMASEELDNFHSELWGTSRLLAYAPNYSHIRHNRKKWKNRKMCRKNGDMYLKP